MKTFVFESPSPNDLLDERNEAASLLSICKMFGHKAAAFLVKSKSELREAFDYVSEIEMDADDILCLHLSCHGNDDGLAFGKDFLKWAGLGAELMEFLSAGKFRDKYILIISACGANEQKLTKRITELDAKLKKKLAPPSYIFIYDELEVSWKDALLSWTILYHQLGKLTKLDKEDVQLILEKMKAVQFGNLIYFRWDYGNGKYMRFRPAK